MNTPTLIDKPEDLQELCRQLAGADFLAVDTEFIRERTYYPQLCLVQVATSEIAACVDAVALDMAPLNQLILDSTITKVLHSARQDFEIFAMLTGQVPAPLFDTQVAADLCGMGDQGGFAAVADRLLGVSIDKSHARTDWSRRPLRDEQLQYALDDVLYLVPIYEKLAAKLAKLGRMAWLQEECDRLLDPALYSVSPQQAWQRLGGLGGLDRQRFHTARLLARWREKRAISMDRPRGWVLRDDVLLRIASAQPESAEELGNVKGLPRPLLRKESGRLLELVDQARDCDDPVPDLPERLTAEQRKRAGLMMETVRQVAAEIDVSAATLATRRDIKALVRGDSDSLPLRGWRREVIGERLLAL